MVANKKNEPNLYMLILNHVLLYTTAFVLVCFVFDNGKDGLPNENLEL